MFKIGDKVICINDELKGYQGNFEIVKLKEYTIKKIVGEKTTECILFFNGVNNSYFSSRFLTIPEFRKMKINKIKESINEKR
jgi:hypothetical protein